MKAPVLGRKNLIPVIVIVAILSIANLVVNAFALPGWLYTGLTELLLTTLVLVLFAADWSGSTMRYGILVYVAATGLQIIGQRYPALFGELRFGTALGPYSNNVGLLIGLPWFLSIMLSLQIAQQLTRNIYLASLVGTVMAMGASVFMIYNGEALQYFYWVDGIPLARAFIIWSVAIFILQFAGIQMQIRFENVAAKPLYVTWFGFHFVLFCLRFAVS